MNRYLTLRHHVTPIDWHADAACVGQATRDYDPWHPAPQPGHSYLTDVADAAAICARCPVAVDCLAWAMDNDVRYGVYGGLTPEDRLYLARRSAS